jgi:hypothetical protein
LAENPDQMRPVFFLAALALVIYGCSKHHSGPSGNTPSDLPPAITPAGTPVDSGVVKSIGSGGGTITSADGRLQLIFPAGALSANTSIGIQAVTNTAPGGAGVSYRLTPEGTKFATPVTLTFHYTNADAAGTFPYLFYIAYQDNTGKWYADSRNRTVDTVGRTVTLPIHHFSIWTLGSQLNISAVPSLLNENERSAVSVYLVKESSQLVPDPLGGDDLATLPVSEPLDPKVVTNWKVNGAAGGNAVDGTISGSGASATYTAPATIDKERTVQVSAEANYSMSYFNNGKLVASVNKFILFENITLEPGKLSFLVDVITTLKGTSEVYNDVYTDEVKFQVDLDHIKVTVSNITNFAPKVSPSSGSSGTATATWVPDGIGITNMVSATGFISSLDNSVSLLINHTGTVLPKWNVIDIYSGNYTFGGDAAPGSPPSLTFIGRDSAQVYNLVGGVYTYTVTPLH